MQGSAPSPVHQDLANHARQGNSPQGSPGSPSLGGRRGTVADVRSLSLTHSRVVIEGFLRQKLADATTKLLWFQLDQEDSS